MLFLLKTLSIVLGIALLGSCFLQTEVLPMQVPVPIQPNQNFLCTGFFITPDGAIGTAGHCAGTNLTAWYYQNGVLTKADVSIVGVDVEHDSMILQPTKPLPQPVPFYNLNFNDNIVGSDVAYIGYPDPWKYGFFEHSYHGRLMFRNARGLYVSSIWADHGASGSGVYDSQSDIVGILTEGYTIDLQLGSHSLADVWLATGVQPIRPLILMALADDINVTVVNNENLDPITAGDMPSLYIENQDKVVVILGETDQP